MEVFVFWGFVVRCKADWIQIVRLWYIALIIQNSGFYAFQITEILLDPGEPILKTTHKGKVHQFTVAISFLSGKIGVAGAAGDRAAWICECGYVTPLVGRCRRYSPPSSLHHLSSMFSQVQGLWKSIQKDAFCRGNSTREIVRTCIKARPARTAWRILSHRMISIHGTQPDSSYCCSSQSVWPGFRQYEIVAKNGKILG